MGNLKQKIAISEEDALRADMYGFLAELLRAEPEAKLLKSVASLSGDESALGKSISTLWRIWPPKSTQTLCELSMLIFSSA